MKRIAFVIHQTVIVKKKKKMKNWNYLNQQCVAQQECVDSVDEELLMVTSVFETFEGIDSVEASRHNLTSDPDAFVNNSTILKLLQQKEMIFYQLNC